ncbi:unnamed protein product [Enterobius vermicularis]|uniref:DUF3475 domain-containing protein n=1 Tax=Enterobius vermicularis TaxID=51028 RepID=A0A0N4VBF3_ENTVE|nr:unnamed protein product [Enterobius vermicularis]
MTSIAAEEKGFVGKFTSAVLISAKSADVGSSALEFVVRAAKKCVSLGIGVKSDRDFNGFSLISSSLLEYCLVYLNMYQWLGRTCSVERTQKRAVGFCCYFWFVTETVS